MRAEAALHIAITLAKRSESAEVTPDHILAACLLSLSSFGIARLGRLTVDLESLGIDWLQDLNRNGTQAKVKYSDALVALLDRATVISHAAGASAGVRILDLLAAFDFSAPHGLIAQLLRQGVSSADWRAALAEAAAVPLSSPAMAAVTAAATYVSPEQAAEILGVHHQTIRGYIRAGKLPAFRIAGERVVRIRRQDLDRLLEPVTNPEPESIPNKE